MVLPVELPLFTSQLASEKFSNPSESTDLKASNPPLRPQTTVSELTWAY